jgi:hypothetical protein
MNFHAYACLPAFSGWYPGLPDGLCIFKPKIPIWVNFRGRYVDWKMLIYFLAIWSFLLSYGIFLMTIWYILCSFGKFVSIWYILCPFDTFFRFWYHACTEKNLATLLASISPTDILLLPLICLGLIKIFKNFGGNFEAKVNCQSAK